MRPGIVRCALLGLVIAARASADGFQLERFEPASPGSGFFGVEHPWYSSVRPLAVGLTIDYGHNELLGGTWSSSGFHSSGAVVDHQLVGHLAIAGALFDRVQLAASLPIVLDENGTSSDGVNGAHGAALGDARLGALARLYGHADRNALSLHAGAQLWIPLGGTAALAGESSPRVEPQLVLAGTSGALRWALSAGALLRATTQLGQGPASTIGSELEVRAGVAWQDAADRFHIGPELALWSALTGNNAFARDGTGMEILLGGRARVLGVMRVGAAVGAGVVSSIGGPDVRVILGIEYAPPRPPPRDSDADGIPDAEDACPTIAGAPSGDPHVRGCPRDTDGDGVPEAEDLCPNERAGEHPDPARKGCPNRDVDGDGVPEAEDLCPNEKAGEHPDPARKGCPNRDVDGDGVPEAEDLCPNENAGEHPDPARKGCPNRDVDGDGVPEAEDLCPNERAGAHPDPARKGCPAKDTDQDGVPDAEDSCPNLAGPADADPKRSGCPKVAEEGGSRTELKSVHFATGEAALLPESLPVLDDAAKVLLAHLDVKHVVIEGHADDTGTPEFNLGLSKRRAEAVVKYLVGKGVAARRLKPVGYGDTRPLSNDRSDESRARNRRVEMTVPSGKH